MTMAQSIHTCNMENVLQKINSKYIKLEKDKEFDNNIILHSTRRIVEYMKKEDPLFDVMFREIFFGGSYYDGLRVGKPNEFDLDLLLDIRKFGKHKFDEPSNIPGFVRLKVIKFTGDEKPEKDNKKFRELFDKDSYLCTDKTFLWMERVFHRAFNHLPGEGPERVLETIIGNFKIRFSRKAPAFTLHIHTIDGSNYYDKCGKSCDKTEVMTVDLVPCFVFTNDDWPSCGFRSNLVPEKKLRDRYDHCIASYHIKTVVLHMTRNQKYDDSFWQSSLQSVFMAVLEEYAENIKNQTIPYFWYRRYNLIRPETLTAQKTLENIRNKLKAIINDIKKNLDKPKTVAKYLLTEQEYSSFNDDTEDDTMCAEMSNLTIYN